MHSKPSQPRLYYRVRLLGLPPVRPFRLLVEGHRSDVVEGLDGRGAHPRQPTYRREPGQQSQREEVRMIRRPLFQLVGRRVDGAYRDVLIEEEEHGEEDCG